MQKGKSLSDIAKVLTVKSTIEYQRQHDEHYHTTWMLTPLTRANSWWTVP